MTDENKNGRWITTKTGHHVFIKNGQTIEEALEERFGEKRHRGYRIFKSGSNNKWLAMDGQGYYGPDAAGFDSSEDAIKWLDKNKKDNGTMGLEEEDENYDYDKFDTDQEEEFEKDDWSKWATKTDKKVPENWESDGWDGDTRFYAVNDQKGVRSASINPKGYTTLYTENGAVSFKSLDEAKEFMNLKNKSEAEDYLWDKNGYIDKNSENAYDDMFSEFDEEEFNEDTSDYEPNWDENKDKHYQAYNEKVKNAKYDENEINKILRIADDYSKEADRGFISYDQMDRYAEKMGLKDLSDKELRQTWDKYYNILSRQSFKGGSMNNYRKFGDAASAFAEIINREARSRKEKGNYFPYDDNDVNEAKNKIASIAKKHEGYDMDSNEAYLTSDETNQIKQIANEYHITDEDLEKLSNLFNRRWGYTGYGYKKGN